MAAHKSGSRTEVTTVLACEGDLRDPGFPAQLCHTVGGLDGLLGEEVKVRKLEPWNSVRVTLSIPRDAALRLRRLAGEGPQRLRSLGILSVQVEGDQVVSLRVAAGPDQQEVILSTAQDGSSGTDRSDSELGAGLAAAPSAAPVAAPVQFKSPNVVCPSDSVVPRVGTSCPPSAAAGNGKAFAGPFPFASMNQAMHSSREAQPPAPPPFNPLPPPYPGKHPPVTISSPLLVNLLQNDGAKEPIATAKQGMGVRPVRGQTGIAAQAATRVVAAASVVAGKTGPPGTQQSANNSISPSALSTSNTSIRQNSSTISTSTMATGKSGPPPPLPPPQYPRTQMTENKLQTPVGLQKTKLSTAAVNNSQHSNFPLVQSHSTLSLPNSNSSAQSLPLNQAPPNNLTHQNVPLQQKNVPWSLPTATLSHPNNIIHQSQNKVRSSNPLGQTNSALSQGRTPSKVPPNATVPFSRQDVTQNTNSPHQPQHNVPRGSQQHSVQPNAPNVLSKNLPSPPPYSVAVSRTWDNFIPSTNSLLDLTPSLDLKPDELDELLPSLEKELAHSPLLDILPEDLLNSHANIMNSVGATDPNIVNANDSTRSIKSTEPAGVEPKSQPTRTSIQNDSRKFLINPLTGELEPHSGTESDTEEPRDVFTDLPSPDALSDEDTNSTIRPDTATDQSDSETRSSGEGKHPRFKNPKAKDRGRDSPALKPTEKIKLRLKLEKSEPINPAYKVDVSFVNAQPKKASSSVVTAAAVSEELRVPPLHISLRGRNSVVIKNKNKLNPDGTPRPKVKKKSDMGAAGEDGGNAGGSLSVGVMDQVKLKNVMEQKKIKKFKVNHEHKDLMATLSKEGELKPKLILHNHYKDKQPRRGSDSELVKNNKRHSDNGILDERKRRLSQSEQLPEEDRRLPVLGSTNIGTITALPLKPRKDKLKVKDTFKNKDLGRNKFYGKGLGEKIPPTKQFALPTALDVDMEAKFKQSLLEGTIGEKGGTPWQPHRTDPVTVQNTAVVTMESNQADGADKMAKTLNEGSPLTEKPIEPDKCNMPQQRRSTEMGDKPQPPGTGGRSPNTGGGGQGEDSGIESMDALSEKSPNQASQSPHADVTPPTKAQPPDMLDIEAQLAKMEGLNGDADPTPQAKMAVGATPTGDVNENERAHRGAAGEQCCDLARALQDDVVCDKGIEGALSQELAKQADGKANKDDLEPLPLRVLPALYTYSNTDKGRGDSESPSLSDEDSNSCSTTGTLHGKSKSLLEQLLIDIPNDHQSVPSLPSPATRSSVRTRALSKLGSPELPKSTRKRKRNESDSSNPGWLSNPGSNHNLEDSRKKPRKLPETDTKPRVNSEQAGKLNNVKKPTKVQHDESSDSDEPLIEKLRKNNTTTVNTQPVGPVKAKVKGAAIANKVLPVNTRRSVRANTRTKGDKAESAEALRRKTRSADMENKRKKEVK